MDVGDDEVGVLLLSVGSGDGVHDAADPAHDKHTDESQGE